jgi:hypothetical protein
MILAIAMILVDQTAVPLALPSIMKRFGVGTAVAWILGKIIDKTMGFRVSAEDEATGVDLTQHAETAYDFGSIHLGHTPGHAVTGADQKVTDQDEESVIGAR